MELDYAKIGQRIALRRKQAKLRQNALAASVGISNNYLSSIEGGKEKPSLEILVRICNVLQVTPDYLLMGAMHSNNVSKNISDALRLCTQDDIEIISAILQVMIKRGSDKWNSDNFT